eukprot:scaffold22474_cov25-Prasinocladus_malaysianus.AAC.1
MSPLNTGLIPSRTMNSGGPLCLLMVCLLEGRKIDATFDYIPQPCGNKAIRLLLESSKAN